MPQINILPRSTFAIMRCDNSIRPNTRSAIATLPLKDLAAITLVPVQNRIEGVNLRQKTDSSWDRQLVTNRQLGCPDFSSPVILSPRNNWHFDDIKAEAFDQAIVVDGAKRLEDAFNEPSIDKIPVVILFGLEPTDEISIWQKIHSGQVVSTSVETRVKFDTTSPQLKIGQEWTEVEFKSDPFVKPSEYGYIPIILVQRPHNTVEHLPVQAKTLSKGLERFRDESGTLNGVKVEIRKSGPGRMATYEIQPA